MTYQDGREPAPGPPMLDMTDLVKKPASKQPLLGFVLLDTKQFVIISFSLVMSLPFAATFWRFGFMATAFATVLIFSASGWLITVVKPGGINASTYIKLKLTGKMGKVAIDGYDKKYPVYVGVARVRDHHGGEKFRLANAAVEVRRDMLDDRGIYVKQ